LTLLASCSSTKVCCRVTEGGQR